MDRRFLYLLIVAILILQAYYWILQSEYSTRGEEINRLLLRINQIKRENQLLQTEYLQETALGMIEIKAQRMGFIPVSQQMQEKL